MDSHRNGTGPEHELERELRRAADEATASWSEREQAIRERWERQQEASRTSASDATEAARRNWERQTNERLDRIQGSSIEQTNDVQARLEQLREMATDLEAERRAYEERSLWGRFKRWWNGLGKRDRGK